MKTCCVCHKNQSLSEFHRDKSKKDGRASSCKECSNHRVLMWQKNNIQRHKDNVKRWRLSNPTKMQDFQRKYEFGLSLGTYDKMYKEQGGSCYICRKPKPILCVDHNHKTGAVRGLLCRSCNLAIGFMGDNPYWLEWAASYLRIFHKS